jgi:antitoxin (DNA-binding transcriptional repressor) of toxin-antitoxin stability system
MVKKVSATVAHQSFSEIIDRIQSNGEEYIIEQNGHAVAALVPVEVLLNRQQARDRIGVILSERAQHVASLGIEINEKALGQLVNAEVHKVRHARHSARPASKPKRR